ncbi:MAG: RdgB/HAM1 family non-canonical purine NTP pyrophosphatase [Acidimicrobiales bacterium]
MSADSGRLRLVIASANPDKAREMLEILRGVLDERVEFMARPEHLPAVEEDGETLEENARLKAEAVRAATGIGALADDTGFEVDALGGLPGVRAARYAGPDGNSAANIAKLLAALGDRKDRRARFRTVALAILADGTEIVATGTLEGTISMGPRGAGGFGYDPVFLPDSGDGRTLAEMDTGAKHEISHRGRALRTLAGRLEEYLADPTG